MIWLGQLISNDILATIRHNFFHNGHTVLLASLIITNDWILYTKFQRKKKENKTSETQLSSSRTTTLKIIIIFNVTNLSWCFSIRNCRMNVCYIIIIIFRQACEKIYNKNVKKPIKSGTSLHWAFFKVKTGRVVTTNF